MNINWYPGHMKKTKESIQKNLKMVDVIFELIDSRIPYSSKNPDIDSIIGEKPKIVILNKSDLSSAEGNEKWQNYYSKNNIKTVLVDSVTGKGINKLLDLSYQVTDERRKSYKKRGVVKMPTRAMILGIPNVGKSTLINTLSGRKGAKIGNRPGITKTNQWIKTKGKLELLDTPGILWPKLKDKEIGINLAFTGAIKDEILDVETLALKLIERLVIYFPNLFKIRYNIEIENKSYLEIMEDLGRKRGCIIRGGEIDYTKISNILLDDFRKGRIGNITLEFPEE